MTVEENVIFQTREAADLLGCAGEFTGAFSSVQVDSRRCTSGALFVALKGERVDGHDYVEAAAAGGARTFLVDAEDWGRRKDSWKKISGTFLPVSSALRGMQILAREYLARFKDIFKVGVTGSNGKTTTKEILGSIFRETAATYINEGNLNSDIGLPLSVFKIRSFHKQVILEMGMNYRGEMDILADIVKPDFGIITNIGSAHIGPLGSVDAIANEKKKIFKYFGPRNKGFVKEDEKYFSFLTTGVDGKFYSYGLQTTRNFEGYRNLGLDGTTIYWEGLQIHFPLFGYHNLMNALGSMTLAAEAGIPVEAVKRGLENTAPLFGRSQIIRGEITLIQDCYNANPDSVSTSLQSLDSIPWKGRKMAILGSMLELGEKSAKAHGDIALKASQLNIDHLIFFGEEMGSAHRRLEETEYKGFWFWTDDFDRLRKEVERLVAPGDLVLLKGSRGVALERLAEILMKNVA